VKIINIKPDNKIIIDNTAIINGTILIFFSKLFSFKNVTKLIRKRIVIIIPRKDSKRVSKLKSMKKVTK